MCSNKLLGVFEYGEKKASLEKTEDGYLVTLTNVDQKSPEPIKTPYQEITRARRAFEQAVRRTISASILDDVFRKPT